MKPNSIRARDALQTVLDYHQTTKHHFHHYANGPGYLDWATQPDPFRRYEGARVIPLEKTQATDMPLYDDIFAPGRIASQSLSLQSISQLFFDSLAISAWKAAGDTRWALRVNPSSGNLHPTEGYLICGPVAGLCDKPMVCHYTPQMHGLEVLAKFDSALWEKLCVGLPESTILVVLTSIHWREAWKYGQRAYRYCQHDVGHAIGAISIAAAGLGWQAKILDDLGTDELLRLTGTFREHDAEPEEPDVLIALCPVKQTIQASSLSPEALAAFSLLDWKGYPNRLSLSRIEWGIDEIAKATRKPEGKNPYHPLHTPSQQIGWDARSIPLRQMIHQRRSAVAMDGVTQISRDTFFHILQKTLATSGAAPFNAFPWKPHIHLAIFVHRVNDIPPGLYFLVRDASQLKTLKAAFAQTHTWKKPAGCPDPLELYCLIEADAQKVAQQISCSQAIASEGCFSLGMIAEYQETLENHGPWFYPRLFWEAGAIGQLLYLEAEAAGIRSTGIGCYFDDPMHDVLGLADRKYQDLYHFTVGGSVEDVRLTTLPAYSDR